MASSALHQASALDPDNRLIGFIKLSPPVDGVCQCKFHTRPLEGDTPFIALLYEWGTELSNHATSTDRHEIFIRNILAGFAYDYKIRDSGRSELQDTCMFSHIPLLSYRAKACFVDSHRGHVHRLPLIWVDAIYIDQENTRKHIFLV